MMLGQKRYSPGNIKILCQDHHFFGPKAYATFVGCVEVAGEDSVISILPEQTAAISGHFPES